MTTIKFNDLLNEDLKDDRMRLSFGAEGIKLEFAFALLNARESVGMTQEQLAEVSGFSPAYISKLETGDANPNIDKLGAIFAAMWMEPSVGFGPLMPEDSEPTGSDEADPAAARQGVVGSAVDDD